ATQYRCDAPARTMARAREASRMGDGWTIGRGCEWPVQQDQTANADDLAVLTSRGGSTGPSALTSRAARSSDGARSLASTVLPSIHRELTLAWGAWCLPGALGVRSSAQGRLARRGEQAGVWPWQPTGRTPSSPCSMDGRAEPAQAGRNCVPPARDGRLVP